MLTSKLAALSQLSLPWAGSVPRISAGRSGSLVLLMLGAVVATRLLRLAASLITAKSLLLLVPLYVSWELYWKRRLLPPGPTPWLIAGNIVALAFGDIDDVFQKWKREYGPVFTVWVGPIPFVMVADFETMKRYYVQNAEVFSNRWRNHVTDTFMGGVNGVVQIDGPKWREQRRFSLHVLRDFGVGRQLMEGKIMHEVNELATFLSSSAVSAEGGIEMSTPIAICVGNIINNMLFSKTFPQGSPEMAHLHHLLDHQSRLVVHPIMGLYIAAPWTTHIPVVNGKWRELLVQREAMWGFLTKQVQQHRSMFDAGHRDLDDFTFAYMREIEKREMAGEDMGSFSEWQLTMLLLDLFFAGMETTVTTLKWGFLLTALNEKVQRRVQCELDSLSSHSVSLSDRPNLPYTQAVINEMQRVANILPINLLRTVSEDVDIDGFHFKQNTLVIPQISILLNDGDIFEDPKSFRPERFLDDEGKLKRYEEFIPFSIGKRQCLGESLARAELFLIYANMMKKFQFSPVGEPSTERLLGLTVSPPRYNLTVRPRKMDENGNAL